VLLRRHLHVPAELRVPAVVQLRRGAGPAEREGLSDDPGGGA
jgi:hypothetical protein